MELADYSVAAIAAPGRPRRIALGPEVSAAETDMVRIGMHAGPVQTHEASPARVRGNDAWRRWQPHHLIGGPHGEVPG